MMEPNERLKMLTNKASPKVEKTIPAIKYYRSGVEVSRMADTYYNEGNLENAFVLYYKYITLFLEKIREHPEHGAVPASEKTTAMNNIKTMLPKAEKLKAVILEQYRKEYEVWLVEKERREQEQLRLQKEKPPTLIPLDLDLSLETESSEGSSLLRGCLRSIIIPNQLIKRFLELASGNTSRNIETCALLTGTLQHDRLTITVLLLPQQTGTSDDCATENDLATFNVIENRNLITLGWIHTHPSQNAFLSSVDLHSHFGYQSMLPEAIAIVCAPKYSNEVFRLSDMGLDIIRNCTARGFHPHPGPTLFENASHAQMVDIPFDTVDLR